MTGMKVKARILVLSLVCSAMLLAQTQWSEFSNPKVAFKVLLPGKPVQSFESPATFVLSTATGIYLISYTDAHDGGDAAEIFKNERDSVLRQPFQIRFASSPYKIVHHHHAVALLDHSNREF